MRHWGEHCCLQRSKACLQKVISGSGLKYTWPLAKILDLITDYVKLVATMCYCMEDGCTMSQSTSWGSEWDSRLTQHRLSSIPGLWIEMLRALLATNSWWTTRELSMEVGLSHQTVWHILKKNLNMRKIFMLGSTYTHRGTEMTAVCTGWSPSWEVPHFCSVLSLLMRHRYGFIGLK